MDSRAHTRSTRLARGAALAISLAAVVSLAVGSAGGATSSTVVSASVASATSLSSAGCTTGAAPTTFGTVLPGTSSVTGSACKVLFGSSNDTSMLRLYQQYQAQGAAMVGGSDPTPLDTSFGTSGTTTTAIGTSASGRIGVDPTNGDLISTGSATIGGNLEFALAAYNPTTGVLDPSFGTAGITTTAIGTAATAGRPTIDPANGDIILTGNATVGGQPDFALAAYNPTTGALDPSFGTAGITTTAIGTTASGHPGVVDPGNGDLVVPGTATVGGQSDFAVAAYNASTGLLDPSFGTAGITTTAIGTTAAGNSMSLDPTTGDLITAGTATVGGQSEVAVAAYAPATGVLDPSFGSAGVVTTAVGTTASGSNVVADPAQGDLVVSGTATVAGQSDFAIVAYGASSGALDPGFGSAGVTTTAIGTTATGNGIIANPTTGELLQTGTATVAGQAAFAVVAYVPATGALDPHFGTGGMTTTAIGTTAAATNLVIDPANDDLVTGGSATVGGQSRFALAAYTWWGTKVNDYTSSGSGSWGAVSGSGVDLFGACLEQTLTGAGTDGSTWSAAGAGNCTTTDAGSLWHAVPASSGSAGIKIADSTTTGTLGAEADLRFGLRTATNQPPGAYYAPLVLDVAAPNV